MVLIDLQWHKSTLGGLDILSVILTLLNGLVVLDEKSPELKKIIDAISADVSPCLIVQYHLERAACQLEYFERSKAQLSLKNAAEAAGIKLELDGALSKRTHFQCRSNSNQRLCYNESSSMSGHQETEYSDLPLNCKNTDDTLLDSVNFDDRHLVEASTSLSDEQLACIPAIGIFERKSMHSSADGVDAEVPFVYVDKV
uniref:Uncharacterized protein n=1 Tax=Ditylenchus dipsaci TaxID=166011 RepID=A0A915EEP4_9BILA